MEISHPQNGLFFERIAHLPKIRLPGRKVTLGVIILAATVLFEAFNYSTSEHALMDAFGELGFLGIPLATILALAFCGLDFAGIARLFSAEDREEAGRTEGIYLLAAWILAGSMNAVMTWWSVTESLLGRPAIGNEVFARQDLILYVPILVAGGVWLIRILLIGALTMTGASFFASSKPAPETRRPAPARMTPGPANAVFVRPFTGGRS
jgi:hypothetical protein